MKFIVKVLAESHICGTIALITGGVTPKASAKDKQPALQDVPGMGPGKQCYILPVGQVVQIKMAAWSVNQRLSVEGTTFLETSKLNKGNCRT